MQIKDPVCNKMIDSVLHTLSTKHGLRYGGQSRQGCACTTVRGRKENRVRGGSPLGEPRRLATAYRAPGPTEMSGATLASEEDRIIRASLIDLSFITCEPCS